MHDAVALGDAAAARAVEADRVHFVEIGQRAVLFGEVADRGDRRDMPVHRVDALEGDDLRRGAVELFELRLEVLDVVVAPDALGTATMANAGDHRGVVLLVGEDDGARQQLRQGGERRVVGDIGGGEQQRRFLAVQVGELALQLDVIVRGAGDVARAARTGADRVDGLVHGGDHGGMLAHAEVVVGAPDGDRARGLRVVEVLGGRIGAAPALHVGKHAVAAFAMDGVERNLERLCVVHPATFNSPRQFFLHHRPPSLEEQRVYCRAGNQAPCE